MEKRTYRRLYVGMPPSGPGTVFRSPFDPRSTADAPAGTCYVIGPFRTLAAARLCASGEHSPHLQHVSEFERAARYLERTAK